MIRTPHRRTSLLILIFKLLDLMSARGTMAMSAKKVNEHSCKENLQSTSLYVREDLQFAGLSLNWWRRSQDSGVHSMGERDIENLGQNCARFAVKAPIADIIPYDVDATS